MRTHGKRLGVSAAVLLAGLSATASAETSEIEGQVVCSQCWFEADRSRVPYGSPDDLSCAVRCSEAGVPAALAVRAKGSYDLLLLDDRPAGARPWIEIVGRFVRVTGETIRRKDARVLRAATVELLDVSPWADRESASAEPVDAGALSWSDLSGHPLVLDGLRGRVVVLNFWATWCVPCQKELPDLVRVQNRYGALGVQVIGAAADAADRSDVVLEFARRKKLNFPVVLGADTRQMESLGLGVVLPATVVLDREGHVIERFHGVFDPDTLAAAVDRALSGNGSGNASDEHAAVPGHIHVASAAGPGESLVPS